MDLTYIENKYEYFVTMQSPNNFQIAKGYACNVSDILSLIVIFIVIWHINKD